MRRPATVIFPALAFSDFSTPWASAPLDFLLPFSFDPRCFDVPEEDNALTVKGA